MSRNISQDKFNFFIPATFEKSGENGELKIKGVCSSNVEDLDGEFLDPTGFDFQPLLEKGFFNWNHQANKSASAILGRPTTAQVINNGKDFYVEGFLYKGLEEAKSVYNLAQVLENEDPSRRLGFSIEGQAIDRDPINPKRIKRARITGVAITHCPKNPNTLLSIMKGEYSEPFVEEETLDKAIEVNTDINPESVEGKPKELVEKDKVVEKAQDLVTKSEIYNFIFNKYTQDISKAKEIYSFVQNVNKKMFNNMANEITNEAIQKAFELLDSSIMKSDVAQEQKTPADYDKKDELLKNEKEVEKSEDKAVESDGEAKTNINKGKGWDDEAKDCVMKGLKEGKTKGQVEDDLVEKGYNMTECSSAVAKLCSEYSANKDGGNITEMGAFSKSFSSLEEKLEKSESTINTTLKDFATEIGGRFQALGEILKGQNQNNLELQTTVSDLTKSFESFEQRIQRVETEPYPKKSVTNLKAVERFQKSEVVDDSNTFSLSKSEDRKALGDRMFAEVEKLKNNGRENNLLEKAIMDLEISKSLPGQVIPTLNSLGIKVVQ